MTTLDTLKTEHPNYIKLIGDPRVLKYAPLAIHVTIHQAISALEHLREEEKENIDQTALTADAPTAIMVYWSEAEIKELSEIEHNIKYLKKKQTKLSDSYEPELEAKKQENREVINKYQTKMEAQSEEINSKIDHVFETLEYEVTKCKNNAFDQMKKHETDIAALEMNHIRRAKNIETTFQTCLRDIHKNIDYFVNIKKECISILNTYPNNIGSRNSWNIFGTENREREKAIVEKCDIAQEEYKKQSVVQNDNINEIYKYISTGLELSTAIDEHVYPSINQIVYARICHAEFIEITDDHVTEEKESEMKEIIEIINQENPPFLQQSLTQTEFNPLNPVPSYSVTSVAASITSSPSPTQIINLYSNATDYILLTDKKKPMRQSKLEKKRKSLKVSQRKLKKRKKNVKKRSKSIGPKNGEYRNWWKDYVRKVVDVSVVDVS